MSNKLKTAFYKGENGCTNYGVDFPDSTPIWSIYCLVILFTFFVAVQMLMFAIFMKLKYKSRLYINSVNMMIRQGLLKGIGNPRNMEKKIPQPPLLGMGRILFYRPQNWKSFFGPNHNLMVFVHKIVLYP